MSMQEAAQEAWTHHSFTVSDGTRLHYVEMGKGTPVILIHGAGGSAVGNWFANGIAPALAPTNRVIGLDMRGHGLSEAGPAGARAHMANDVLEFMGQQGIEKAHIGGYSMGGGVTLALLARNPEKFITASFGGSGIGEIGEWRDRVPPDKEGADPEAAKAQALYREARAARGEEVGNNAAELARRFGAREGQAAADLEAFRQAAERRRTALLESIDLTSIRFPVLAVNGEYDRPRAKTHRMWRELTSFTNVVLPGKGHLSAVMAGLIPQQYIDSMTHFIRSHNPR
jgi:pimeloyl-ACP methyl ester carboxylesterase